MKGEEPLRRLWAMALDGRPPAVATLPVMAMTNGVLYVLAGVCSMIVLFTDPVARTRPLLVALPIVATLTGVVSLWWGRRLPRWSYHVMLVAGTWMITAGIFLAHDLAGAPSLLGLYVFAVLDGAFFFAFWGLCFHLSSVFLVTTVLLPLADIPWQTILVSNGVLAGTGFVTAYLSRSVDLAEIDSLTHLINRRGLERRLADGASQATDGVLSVILVDLDGFKEINDAEGHQVGDELLKRCADTWLKLIPLGVELGRYGGDEFILIATGWGRDDAIRLADALRIALPRGIGASAGVATWQPGESGPHLLQRVDQALYAAKADGRDRTVAWSVELATGGATGPVPRIRRV
ncbi:MAG: GGDEF domain-containing protein [Nocardioides sp.]